jgi:hypothetical protein
MAEIGEPGIAGASPPLIGVARSAALIGALNT